MTAYPLPEGLKPSLPPVTADTEWIESPTVLANLNPGTRVTDDSGFSYWKSRFGTWEHDTPRPGRSRTDNSWGLLYHFGRVRITYSIPRPSEVVNMVLRDAHNIPQDEFAQTVVDRLSSYGYIKQGGPPSDIG